MSDIKPAEGFAVIVNGLIDVRTVHNTERGAQVNGLLVLFDILVRDDWNDNQIEATWKTCASIVNRDSAHVYCRKVMITTVGGS